MVCDFIIINITMLILLISLISAVSAITVPTTIPSENRGQDLVVAIEEMQKANYFTFIMLINMSPSDDQKMFGNVTFLMPNDKTLSKANLNQQSVSDFLLHHTIPSALLFENLEHIPSGSLIPSSNPEYMLKISNGGRKSFFLNNVKIISPNICTLGSSIRCHGIDGVLNVTENNTSSLPATCSSNNTSPDVVVATPPLPQSSISAAAPSVLIDEDSNQQPRPEKSAGSLKCLSYGEISFKLVVTLVMLSIMGMLV